MGGLRLIPQPLVIAFSMRFWVLYNGIAVLNTDGIVEPPDRAGTAPKVSEFPVTVQIDRVPDDVVMDMGLVDINDRWKVLIIRDLLEGTKRFGELKKSVGNISQKVLTANLRSMEESGLLTRKVFPEVPPHVEYTLTETGCSLKPVLDAMVKWGTEYKQKL